MNYPLFKILILFILIIPQAGPCQNIVINGSFEDTIPCISNPLPGSVTTAPPWLEISQSPDYFSEIYCGFNSMAFGFQSPKSGLAFVGLGTYTSVVPNFIRETFGQQLSDTLIAGHKYCLSFYVSLAESSHVAIDRIGALFTSFEVDAGDVFSFQLIPQIENTPGNVITDTTNWINISGDFIAQGNESHISIGNFYDDTNTQTLQLPFGDTLSSVTYFYIDDISLIDCTVGVAEIINIDFDIYPNPVNPYGEIYLTLKHQNKLIPTVSIYSIDSKLLYQKEFSSVEESFKIKAQFSPGIYTLKISNEMGVGYKKFVVLK